MAALALVCSFCTTHPTAPKPQTFKAFLPIHPVGWSVPAWCVDPQNVSACASDANDGTSCSCGSSGHGPLLSHAELAIHRWGTYTPTLPALVTETFLSSQSAPWSSDPVMFVQNLAVVGTMTPVTTVSIGTFTPRVRSVSGQTTNHITASGQSGAYWTPYVGSIVTDTTAGAVFWVEKDLGSATAQITEPLAPQSSGISPSIPSVYVTIANGDSLTVSALSEINCNGAAPGLAGVNMAALHVWCAPTIQPPPMDIGGVRLVESRHSGYWSTSSTPFVINSFFDSAAIVDANGNFFGGAILARFPSITQRSLLTADILMDSGTAVHMIGSSTIARAYLGIGSDIDTDSNYETVRIYIGNYDGNIWYADNSLWGPAGMDVHDGAELICSSSCATQLFLSGALSMHGSTTAFPWSASTHAWGAAATITPSAVDSAGAMCDPATGDCFMKRH